MSTQQDKNSSQLALCPSCGAAVSAAERKCWLCHWDLAEEVVQAEVVGEQPVRLPASMARVGMAVGLVSLALATVGVFAVAPGIGVLLGVVFIISVFAVSKAMQEPADSLPIAGRQDAIASAYAPPAAGEQTGALSVIWQVLKVLGIIVLVILASIIAFFTFCLIVVIAISNM